MNSEQVYSSLFLSIAIFLVIFLIFREFFTWYWKQNRIVKLLESIDGHLEKLSSQLSDDDDQEEEKLKTPQKIIVNN